MRWSLEPIITGTRVEVYGLSEDGVCYAKEFIIKCRKGNAAGEKALRKKLESLSSTGPIAGDRAFKPVRNNLFEIKVKDLRMFSFLYGDRIIVLLGGTKKGDGKAGQAAAILQAERMKNEYFECPPASRHARVTRHKGTKQ